MQLAKRSAEAGRPVSERTLRRAFEVRPPKEETVRAYAGAWARWTSVRKPQGDEADQAAVWRGFEARGLELLAGAVSAAPEGPAPVWPPPVYVPGRIRTWPGLTEELKRLHEETGSPSLRLLAASPGAAGRLSKSTISNILNGKRPTLEQLTALLAAFGATRETTDGMLAAYRRIVAEPEPPAVYPCDIVERAERDRETHLVQEETRLRYRGIEPEPEAELDWYDEQLRDAREAEWRRLEMWVGSLGVEELAALNDQAAAASGRDLRSELNDARGRPGETPGTPPTA
ncbi:helix-turn-helix domain-containing protein [Streptomyces sp. NPDC058955]|uniref:helix-turn-helix domain-containing protein n=1 Tax=unclassified Streptomyces TaxID=2593676 RepID=UPI00364A2F55